MALFFGKVDPVDLVERAERAAQDKKTLAEQMGLHPAPPLEHGSRLETAMEEIEATVYSSPAYSRISAAEIGRTRDSCLGDLLRATSNGQMSEELALQVYAEACKAEADHLISRPTTAAALVRTRLKSILPAAARGVELWSWQEALKRGITLGAIPVRRMSALALDTLGECVLEPGDEITEWNERDKSFTIDNESGKSRHVPFATLKDFKPRGVQMSVEGIAKWDLQFVLKP